MANPLFSAGDYLAAFWKLLPVGDAWNNAASSIRNAIFSGFVQIFATLDGRTQDLRAEALPATTLELLPDWESSVGLPDPCAGLSPTIEARRNQVVARIAGSGGQSIAYIIQFAENLGYPITIEQFTPFRAGQATAGQPACGMSWTSVWQVNAPTFTINYFTAGTSVAGDPLAAWGNTVLQCELQRISPAHSTLLFSYD